MFQVFIQSRMSSKRFPGKMLASLKGKPVLWWVVKNILDAQIDIERISVLTSDEPSDDPIAVYSESIGVNVIRESLDDVFSRFVSGHQLRPSDWIIRVTGDSPHLSPSLIYFVIEP